jgi:hypothetical protein
MKCARSGLVGLVLMLGSGAALAQDETSFSDLVGQGYVVVATEAIPSTDATNAGFTSATPSTVVTLQRGAQVAVCAFATVNWVLMSNDSMHNETLCDYRDFGAQASPPPATNTRSTGR